jgi:extradiol dioxygenase family protein
MRRMFRGERWGSLEMPAQLLITMIIVAATASIGFGALSAYSKSAVDGGLRQQAEAVAAAAVRLDSMGLDSSLQISVKLEGSPTEKIAFFRIGYPVTRPLHPYAGMVRFKAQSSEEGHVYVRDPAGNPVPMCSKTGDSLELGEGTHRLQLTRCYDEVANMGIIAFEETG